MPMSAGTLSMTIAHVGSDGLVNAHCDVMATGGRFVLFMADLYLSSR